MIKHSGCLVHPVHVFCAFIWSEQDTLHRMHGFFPISILLSTSPKYSLNRELPVHPLHFSFSLLLSVAQDARNEITHEGHKRDIKKN